MSKPEGTKLIKGQMTARSTAYLSGLLGPVMLAYGATDLRITGQLRALRTNFVVKPAYRKFSVRSDAPFDGPFTEGTIVNDETPFSQDFSLGALGAFMWLQPTLGCAVSAGAGGEGFGLFQAWTNTTARVVAHQKIQFEPTTNTGKIVFIPLGKPFPAFGLTGIMIAISARGVNAAPTMNFVGRTFVGDPTMPSAWGVSLLGTDKTFLTLNEDYNSGNIPFAPANVALAQIGIKAPAVDATATFDIIVAAKY